MTSELSWHNVTQANEFLFQKNLFISCTRHVWRISFLSSFFAQKKYTRSNNLNNVDERMTQNSNWPAAGSSLARTQRPCLL